ncbi:MAG: major capsid protein [Pseudomonadota bacterium]
MPTMNIFEDDAFSLTSLTAAIQTVPYQPGRIGESGLFAESGITTLDAYIEQEDGVLTLLPVSQRGAPKKGSEHGKRTAKSFRVPHVKEDDLVGADAIIGVRSFGSETEVETVAMVVLKRMTPMLNSVEYTLESHRLAAIMGSYYDAAGNLKSLFTEFGVSQQTVAFVLTVDTTSVRTKVMKTLEAIEDALGGLSFSGVRIFCGKNFWEALIAHPDVEKTYLNTQMAVSLRGDPRMELNFGGVTFERYRGTSSVKVGDDEAYAVPEGVVDLFVTNFAPADYIETVGTIGQRVYAKQWPTEGDRGINLEVQSNPLNICTRPRAVIKLTK